MMTVGIEIAQNCNKDLLFLKKIYYEKYFSSAPIRLPTVQETKCMRNSTFDYFFCKMHLSEGNMEPAELQWNLKVHEPCSKCFKLEVFNQIPSGKLPLGRTVLGRLLTIQSSSKEIFQNNSKTCALELVLHWLHHNVYPQSVATASKKINNIFQMYHSVKKFDTKTEGYWEAFDKLSSEQAVLFDVRAGPHYTRIQEHFWNITMSENDWKFYTDQKSTRRIFYMGMIPSPNQLLDPRIYRYPE